MNDLGMSVSYAEELQARLNTAVPLLSWRVLLFEDSSPGFNVGVRVNVSGQELALIQNFGDHFLGPVTNFKVDTIIDRMFVLVMGAIRSWYPGCEITL